MQRMQSERAAWMRTTYQRALAEVAREHARAGAVPRSAPPTVASAATATAVGAGTAKPAA
jgi:hypothetical protein